MNKPSPTDLSTVLFVGCGGAADRHGRLLAARFPKIRLAYYSRTVFRARRLASRTDGRSVEGRLETVLRDPTVDAVFVTSPPATHFPIVLEALAAGKHVLVEKPAFLDGEEFDTVEAAARRSGRQVLVAENYYYKPLTRRLRSLVGEGSLGQVRLIEINAVKRQHADGWRTDPALSGGGSLFEGGIHWVSLLASLGLDIEGARGFFPDAPPGYEKSVVFVAEYAQGAVGMLTYSWEIPGTLRGLRLSRIWGTRGSILFESNGSFVLRTGRRPRLFLPTSRDIQGYRAMLEDFVRSLRSGEAPAYTLQAARRDVELVRSAYAGASGAIPNRRRAS